jgi:hypothetical protein
MGHKVKILEIIFVDGCRHCLQDGVIYSLRRALKVCKQNKKQNPSNTYAIIVER